MFMNSINLLQNYPSELRDTFPIDVNGTTAMLIVLQWHAEIVVGGIQGGVGFKNHLNLEFLFA
jgi:hypothetical protein